MRQIERLCETVKEPKEPLVEYQLWPWAGVLQNKGDINYPAYKNKVLERTMYVKVNFKYKWGNNKAKM